MKITSIVVLTSDATASLAKTVRQTTPLNRQNKFVDFDVIGSMASCPQPSNIFTVGGFVSTVTSYDITTALPSQSDAVSFAEHSVSSGRSRPVLQAIRELVADCVHMLEPMKPLEQLNATTTSCTPLPISTNGSHATHRAVVKAVRFASHRPLAGETNPAMPERSGGSVSRYIWSGGYHMMACAPESITNSTE